MSADTLSTSFDLYITETLLKWCWTQQKTTKSSYHHPSKFTFILSLLQGVDDVYDTALHEFFNPYHSMVDLMCRVAVNQQILTEPIITFSKYIVLYIVAINESYMQSYTGIYYFPSMKYFGLFDIFFTCLSLQCKKFGSCTELKKCIFLFCLF